MAEPVSSFFLDGGLLGMVPREQAEQAASAANKAFMFGLLSGDIGAAYRNAQQSGYGVIDNAIKFQQHQLSLSEASRKAAETKQRQGAQQSALELVPGTGVGSGSFTDPNVELGPGGYGPGYIRPQTNFNEKKYAENLIARGIATPEEMKFALPNIEFVNGVAVDKRNTKPGTFIPNMPVGLDPKGNPVGNVVQGVAALESAKSGAQESTKAQYDFVPVTLPDGSQVMMSKAQLADAARGGRPVMSANPPKVSENVQLYTDPKTGQLMARPVPGATKAVGALAGAKAGAEEGAKAAQDIVPVQLSDGTTINVTRAQAVQAARGGQPLVQNLGPQQQAERQGAGKFNIEQVLTPAKTAADAARSSNTNLAVLSATLKNTPLNQITATDTVQRLAGLAKASGMLTEEAAKNVSNLSALRGLVSGSVLQEQLAQKGPQTEADAKRMTETVTAMGDKDATQFLIDAKIAQNKRTQDYYSHLDKYRREKGTLDGAEEAWSAGRGKESIFRTPEMKKYAPIYDYNGKKYRVFGDGGEPELVK